ncbi:MAG TPA: BamA/TamA family outer membrane protein [Longimicrobiaceae bacterium]|nr:BamA/TamA family outer membrane protein [Longimicrobiaceae bacterium]
MLMLRTRRILLAMLALALPAPLRAQGRTVVVTAGEQYGAGGVHRLLLGEDYRHLWTTPFRVEVLDPERFAGGLRPLRRGGGNQTLSLRLMGADGREYSFRSVDKDHTRALPEDLKNTVVDWVIQDQVSSLHPAAALVADALLDAAGVLHVSPRLYVMPDHPFLGEFRSDFAGMLGMIEERPDDPESDDEQGGGEEEAGRAEEDDNDDEDDQGDPEETEAQRTAPAFAGAVRIVGTEKLFEELEDHPRNRLDSRDYLVGRLMDLLFGDWDRHEDQYRWARFDQGRERLWRAIPRDRDYVFVDYDGALIRAGRGNYPKAVLYRPEYPGNLYGLTINAQHLDRRLLADLTRADFDGVAARLQGRLTDEVIEAALRRMPPEYYERSAREVGGALRGRRDRLREVAGRFYEQIAREAELHGTDERERADIERFADGSVEVRLFELDGDRPAAEPFYRRRFVPAETREVRVFLEGGDDHVVVQGDAAQSILVRVIGGGGDDVLENRSRVPGTRTAFYDSRGDNRFVAPGGTRVDRRPYEEPEHTRGNLVDPPREWGKSQSVFRPLVGWRSNVGPVIGGGPGAVRYGFRRQPHASRWSVQGLYAPLEGRFAAEYTADIRRVNSEAYLDILARLSGMEVTRFHGFGNRTPGGGGSDRYKVWHTAARIEPLWHLPLARRLMLATGPVLRYYDAEVESGTPVAQLRPRGSEAFGEIGAQAAAEWDARDSETFPRNGVWVRAGGAAFPVVWDLDGPFGNAYAEARAYLSLPGRRGPTLALRGGGVQAWGDFPFQEAAFMGGSRTLRGYPFQRFVGERAIYGNAELRSVLLPAKLLVHGEVGATLLADAGRVYAGGESSDTWHSAVGGGLWFAFRQRAAVLSVTYARGERDDVYVRLGFPF